MFFGRGPAMKTTRILTIILLTLSLTAAARAQTAWPPNVVVTPENPGTSDTVTVTISATWTTDCVPRGVSSVDIQGRSIYITLNQPMYLLCNPLPTFWLATASVGPLDAGCYDVYVELSSGAYARAKVASFCVGNGGPASTTATLYTVGSAGIHTVSLDGDVQHLLASHQDSEGLEIRDNRLYVTEKTYGGDLFVYDLAGRYLESIPTPATAGKYLDFVALPERRFALLDNQSDRAFFIDDSGRLLATVSLLTPADSHWQDLKGIVVGNRLILSHDGNNHVLAVDLTTYRLSTFKNLASLPGLLGDISYADGQYYIVVGGRWVYQFTESGTAVLVGGIPEGNATGICVLGDFAYLSVNFANKIYRLDLRSGDARVLASGLGYLRDIECAEDTAVCCGLQPGDRVVLLTDMPGLSVHAVGLHPGALGTVLCCNSDNPQQPLFVSWDNWTNGNNYDGLCDVPPDSYLPYSGWWVQCSDVRLYTGSETCRVDFCQYEPFNTGFSPTTIHAGQSLYLSFGIANCGTANIPAGWKIRYYASQDTTITSGDYFLSESVADFGIAAGAQLAVEEEFLFPGNVPAGQYYLGWILDPGNLICESNENNNAGYIRGTRLTVVGSGSLCEADFCQYDWPGASLSPTTIQAGQYLHLALGIANCGTADIPAGWKIRYYASKDTTITSSDYFLYETTVNPPLEAGTALSGTEDFRFPSGVPAGQYYIGWILDPDNQICESDESNNAGYIHGVRLAVGYQPM
jgi:hypothetical protein